MRRYKYCTRALQRCNVISASPHSALLRLTRSDKGPPRPVLLEPLGADHERLPASSISETKKRKRFQGRTAITVPKSYFISCFPTSS
ncbi:hypothetical protein L209DRAFT_757911 [Thermothelomyces heterothallicus CBS 203.75]